jgi:GNAT superfamily N-acetyltransferase
MVVIFLDDLDKEVLPLEHCPEWYGVEGEWKEEGYNYRLNTVDTVLLLKEGNEIVGHLGIQEDTVRSLSISESYQGQGLSYKLYEFAFNFFDILKSDDAREPVATHLWQKLKKQYGSQISYDKESNQFIFQK